MWYGTETVFIDGKLFGSQCMFKVGDTSPRGHCYAPLNEEPVNSCKREFNNRIEIHTDWFESEELAKQFCDGEITYIHHYDTYYKKSIKSTLSKFTKREIVKVDVQNGIFPCRGVHKEHLLVHRPYWLL